MTADEKYYDQKKKGQIEYLTSEIINGENKNYFKVFNLEAGLKKTLTSEQALIQLAEMGNKALFAI